MPKQKTHKGLAKRVKVTGTGKVRFKRSFGGHLMSTKSAKRRRHISSPAVMSEVFAKKALIKLGKD